MCRITIHIARDGLAFHKNETARSKSFLDNARPSHAIYIDVRRMWRIFTIYVNSENIVDSTNINPLHMKPNHDRTHPTTTDITSRNDDNV